MLRQVTVAAADIFASPGCRRAAVAYLHQRGVDAGELTRAWLIGYAPPGWTRLSDKLRRDFDDQALIDAGVACRSARGTLIDTFRNRVMFGIREPAGRIVGFTGRDLSNDPLAPKYLNTHQHPLFDKGSLLFGLAEGTVAPAASQPVVVEGPIDALAIASRATRDGCRLMPVAPCGTAFSDRHARQLASAAVERRSSVTVAMDADPIGRRAGLAAAERLHHLGVDVRVASLPSGADPAEYLARSGATTEAFRADHAVPLLTAQVEFAVAIQGDRMQYPEGRVAALRSVAARISEYPPSYIAHRIPWIADTLGLHHSTVTLEMAERFARRQVDATPGRVCGNFLAPARTPATSLD